MAGITRRVSALMILMVLAMVVVAACSSRVADQVDAGGSSASEPQVEAAAEDDPSAHDESAADEAADDEAAASADAASVHENGGDSMSDVESPVGQIQLVVGDASFEMELADTQAAEELVQLLQDGAVELDLQEYGGFEKVGPLPWSLTTSDESVTTEPGDVVLYQGNQISVFYGSNTWSYTRLGTVVASGDELATALGEGDATVTLQIAS